MNSKIKELMNRNNIRLWESDVMCTEDDLVAFALSLVNECAMIAENAHFHRLPASTYAGLIKEEFQ